MIKSLILCWGGGAHAVDKTIRDLQHEATPLEHETPNTIYSAPNDNSLFSPLVQHEAVEAFSEPTSRLHPTAESLLGTVNYEEDASFGTMDNVASQAPHILHIGSTNPPTDLAVLMQSRSNSVTVREQKKARSSEPSAASPADMDTATKRVRFAKETSLAPASIEHAKHSELFSAFHSTREMIRQTYGSHNKGAFNPFMTDRYGNRVSAFDGMTWMTQMYYSEGGPFHPRQVALRAAEPDPYKRDQMYKHSLLASYQRMVTVNFGRRGGSSGAMRRSQSTSTLLPKLPATLHNSSQDTAIQDP